MPGNDDPKIICWDSCIFLAWFNSEEDKPLSYIEATLRRIAAQRVTLVVSAVSCVEVLDVAGISSAGTEFQSFIQRPNIIRADFDFRVAEIARAIRIAALEAHREGRLPQSIKIPDAMIAASAVQYGAEILYTFDPILRAISKWPCVRGLPIISPNDEKSPLGY